jgi:short-subunit dehydrogenase
LRIEGKSVIVTGASSGIGRALALAFAGKRAAVTAAARRADRLEELVREAAERFPDAPPVVPVECDVTREADVSWLVGGTVERTAAVDVLVNNAGVGLYGETELVSIDDFQELLSVNLLGAVRCIQEVVPFMRTRESGVIVNVASVAALYGVPYLSAYCASKAAVAAVSQSLRAELDGSGIRVMIAYPGYTDTEFFEHEKVVGGARRPPGPFAPPDRVAAGVVRAVERNVGDVYLTAQGRALSVLRGLAHPIVERAMRKIARELRGEDEPSPDDGKQ